MTLHTSNTLQKVVGPRPFIIPLFLPNIGCPHRCAFCDQSAITGTKQSIPSSYKFRKYVDKFLRYKGKCRDIVELSFYGGNFLGLKKHDILELLNNASLFVQEGKINSIRFSTRPDTINQKKLDLLLDYPVSTIELGVQSMNDRVLDASLRGHTSSDIKNAVNLLKKRKYKTGMQMMVGLPADDESKCVETGLKIAELKPDFVRIYPTVVLKNSILAKWYKAGEYSPMSLEKCVHLVKRLYLIFTKNRIPVIRMGLQADDNLTNGSTILAGPYHPAFGHLVHSEIFFDKAASLLRQKKLLHKTVLIRVHPQNISKIRGLKNRNIKLLKKRFQIKSLNVIPDLTLADSEVMVE